MYTNDFCKYILFFVLLLFLNINLSGQADPGCPTVLVDINDPSTLPSLPASTCIGDSLEFCFETDCPTCDFSDVTLGYTINTTTDPGFTSLGDGFGALCFRTVVPESDGDPCQPYDLEITLSTLNTNDPNCATTNIGYDIDAGFPLQGNNINTIIPTLANFDANPLVVTVHPQYTVVIESPSCDGVAGFAVVQTNGIDCFGPVTGIAGAPNVCPDGVEVNAILDYDFRANVDTAACVTGSLSGTISFDCFESCNGGCTDPLACNYSSNATSDDGSCVVLNAGIISTLDNTTICTGDGNDAIVAVTVTGNVGSGYGYIITEATGTTILGQSGTGSFNLEGAPAGTCLIWGISNYSDFDILTDQVADLVGCYALSNSIEVTREPAGCTDINACNYDVNAACDDGSCFYVESGTVSTTDVTTICSGDGITDSITAVASGGIGSNILYIITSGDGVEILASNDTGVFDLEGAPAGTCLIWAIHYESLDFPTAFVADMTGCFALSNSIEVVRQSVGCMDPTACNYDTNAGCDDGSCVYAIGGVISSNDPLTICSGDGTSDSVNIIVNGNQGSNYIYLVTDATGTTILASNDTGVFDFEGVEAGTCILWGVAFENISITTDQVGDITGCFDLSNPLEIIRQRAGCTNPNACNYDVNAECDAPCVFVEGGTLATSDVTSICTGDGNDAIVNAGVTGELGTNYLYVVTDVNATTILALDTLGVFNFEGAPAGVCLIWGVAYESINIPSDQIADITGCYAFSDAIQINREQAGCTDITACNYDVNAECDDGSCQAAPCNSGCTDPCAPNYDASADADNGSCETYSTDCTSFDDCYTLYQWSADSCSCVPFETIDYVCDDSDDCTADSFDEINCNCINTPIDGCGDVLGCTDPYACNYDSAANTDDGSCILIDPGFLDTNDNTIICTGDGNDDVITITVTDSVGPNYLFLLTDENATTILAVDTTGVFNLEGAPAGVCLIWGVAYLDIIIPASNDLYEIDGCFAFSDPLEVIREQAGCTDITACNYDVNAECDDGSCQAAPCNPGCIDPCAPNFSASADADDGSCEIYDTTCNSDCSLGAITVWVEASCECLPVPSAAGCTDPTACNYDPDVDCDDGSCDFSSCNTAGCTDPCSENYEPGAIQDDGSCLVYDSYCNLDCNLGPIEAWNPATCSCEALPNNMCDDPDCTDFQVIHNVICSPEKDTYEVLISMSGSVDNTYLILDNGTGIIYGPIVTQNLTLGSYDVPNGYSFTVSIASHPECSIDIGMTYVDCTTTDVELTRFVGVAEAEGNVLNWATASENNSKMFILGHSLDGVEFEQVATIQAAGNSNVNQTYTYFDSQKENGNHYYRLQEVRSNNSARIVSEVIVIKRIMDLSIVNIYPVPVRDLLNIEINTDQKEDMVVKLYDISGRIVYESRVVSDMGNNKITIFTGELAVGNYFMKIYSQNVNIVEKFVKK